MRIELVPQVRHDKAGWVFLQLAGERINLFRVVGKDLLIRVRKLNRPIAVPVSLIVELRDRTSHPE